MCRYATVSVGHVDGLYTQRFNRSHGRDGSLFRGRYKAILVDGDEYLAQVVRYIHLNPVGAGLVRYPEECRQSQSPSLYSNEKSSSLAQHRCGIGTVGESKAFHEFVLSGNEEALERFYQSGRQSPVLGGEEFAERIRKLPRQLARELLVINGVGCRRARRASYGESPKSTESETKFCKEYVAKRTRPGKWRRI
jgi:putative transposase